MFSPKVRRKKSDIPPIDRLTLVGRRSSGWRRAKASSRWVSIAARCAPVAALAIRRAMRSRLASLHALRSSSETASGG
jgi:hypothetical protein